MRNVVKFRVKKTVTPSAESEMILFVHTLEKDYEGSLVAFDSTFYVEYHFATSWKHYHNFIDKIKEMALTRPYLILLEHK